MSHSPYLHDIPLPEAQARLQNALQAAGRYDVLGIETIPCDEKALGRVLAAPVWAKISSPHYHAAAMDGFALCARDTIGAQLARPLTLSLSAEAAGRAAYVDTGDALPAWADAVIPIENVEALTGDGALAEDPRRPAAIRIRAAVTPWSHVRLLGEDMVATQLVLPAGQRLRAVDLGAAAACGNSELQAARRPRVAIMPTGSELTPVGQNVQAGQIIETNSITLAAQVNAWGGAAQRFPIIPDHFETICQQVQRAADDFDLILLNAGSSAGSEDFSARVVETLGELLVHGGSGAAGPSSDPGDDSRKRRAADADHRCAGLPGLGGADGGDFRTAAAGALAGRDAARSAHGQCYFDAQDHLAGRG